jgi:hypothetical protein
MALSPIDKYKNQLLAYGLGQGGIQSPTKKTFTAPVSGGPIQRKMRSGIGGSIGSRRSPFSEEGAGLIVEDLSPYKFNGGPMSVEDQKKLNELKKIQGRGASNKPSDVTSFSEFAEAYAELAETNRPEPSISERPDMVSLMESNPSAFADSPLDAIAAQISKAQIDPSLSGANDSEIAQRMVEDKKKSTAAEEFRAQEAKSFDDTSMTIADSEKATEDMFKSAMDEFLGMARGASPEKRERTLEEYKKEFAAATGVDVSGKVDKSQALMALGLGLMQNRAGKGFDVGKILNAVGQAGEKALPALEKAKNKAQTAALAAGRYALESRGSDRAKDEATSKDLMNRGKYWVYKKGSKGAEFEGFDNGEFVDLNKYELNKLIENSDFEKQYEFINASDRMAILEKRAEGVDLGDAWTGYERISLIGGKADDVPPELQVLAAAADPNYEGTTPAGFKLGETPETIVRRFGELQKSINSGAAKFESLISAIDSGVSIPDQMVSTVFTGLRNLGFDIGDEPTDIAQARTMLKEIAVREATNILQESGKTLSDNDRKRVEDLVGEISFVSGDAALIKKKLKEIYKLTVEKPQENLDRAISWLDQNAGISFGPSADDMPTQAELDAMNKVYGTSYTLDVFKQNGASK